MKELNPENPNHMQPILIALANLLSRFTEPEHRWIVGKNTILNTGIYVKQNRAKPNWYTLIFATPDDIHCQCKINMAEFIANHDHEVTALVKGVTEYLCKKRGVWEEGNLDVLTQAIVDRAVASEIARGEQQQQGMVH